MIYNKISNYIYPDRNNYINIFSQNTNNQNTVVDYYKYMYINSICNHETSRYASYYNRKMFYTNKFTYLKEIINNGFLLDCQKDEIVMFLYKIQVVYRGFCRLAYIYKFKKSKKFDTNTDLYGNELSNIKDMLKIDLLLHNMRYEFRLSDLITMLISNLTHSPDFFAEPLPTKNPYTNIAFTRSELYNIYFKVKNSTLNMPTLLSEYFKADFKIKRFLMSNESIIRNYSITDYVNNSSTILLYREIIHILKQYKDYIPNIKINKKFDKNIVVNKFKSALLLYFKSMYSFGQTEQIWAGNMLIKELIIINKTDPTFGNYSDKNNIFKLNNSNLDNSDVESEVVPVDSEDEIIIEGSQNNHEDTEDTEDTEDEGYDSN